MSPRAHLSLRIGALVLLVCAAIWPRARGGMTAEALSRSAREAATARTTAAYPETAAARLVSAPGSAKVVVAVADDSNLTN